MRNVLINVGTKALLSNCPHALLSCIDFSDGGQLDTCCWSELGLLSSLALSVFMAHKVTADKQHVPHPCDIINTNDNSHVLLMPVYSMYLIHNVCCNCLAHMAQHCLY